MSKAKTKRELPRLVVEITTGPMTTANKRAWMILWERLSAQALRQPEAGVSPDNGKGED